MLRAGRYPASAARTASSKPRGSSLRPAGGWSLTIVSADEALDERLDRGEVDGREERDPVGGQPRREERDAEQERPAAALDRGGAQHHLAVGQDVGAAELDLLRRVLGRRQRGEGLRDVVDRDRLGPRVQPLRRDHHRQVLDEALEHQERRRVVADDHRGADVGDGARRRGPARARPPPPRGTGGARRSRPPGRRGRRRARRRAWPSPRRSCGRPRGRARRSRRRREPIECTR